MIAQCQVSHVWLPGIASRPPVDGRYQYLQHANAFCSQAGHEDILRRYGAEGNVTNVADAPRSVREGALHRMKGGSFRVRFGTVHPQNERGVITCGMPLPLVVDRAGDRFVATLPNMGTYHILAAGTVLWLLVSTGGTDSHLPAVLTASLTVGALFLCQMVRSRGEKF